MYYIIIIVITIIIVVIIIILLLLLLLYLFFRNFWEIVREFSESQRKRLLAFITGSDRIPLGGLSKLKLIIVKNGPDSDRYVVLFLGESLKMICGVVDPLFEQPETVT